MKLRSFLGGMILSAGLLLSLPGVAQDNIDGVTIHVVQRGETLFRIAQRYHVTVNDLARLNGLVNPGSIQVGQRLLVPDGDIAVPTAPQSHRVQPGETLRSIADFYRLRVEDLAAINQIANPNNIFVGQELRLTVELVAGPTAEPTLEPEIGLTLIAPATEVPAEIPASEEAASVASEPAINLVHTVRRGETLFRIATQYGLTVNDLVRANGISNPTLIYTGQQLIVPGFEVPELAVDLPAPFTAVQVAPPTLIEGKTVAVQITTAVPALLGGTFLGRELSVGSEDNHTRHKILQGIPLYTAADIYPLDLVAVDIDNGTSVAYTLNLQVAGGPYGQEYIRLLVGRDDLLDAAVEEAEQHLIEGVTRTFTEPRYFSGPMGLPAAATVISPFGTRRSYNGGPFDRFHSGTDFAGAPGTPVLATAPGRVVLADTLNVRGIATVIDHGWGIYTGYWHQSQQYVQAGDSVSTGQVIGTVGSTGRVTGAHLHWELWVGGVPVDPMQWVQFSFS